MIPAWVIFYHDGSTVTSDGCEPQNVPATGVQCILTASPNSYRLHYNRDYYVWAFDTWLEATQDAMWFYLARPGWKKVLFGETVPDEIFDDILRRARNFYPGQKTWRPNEHRPSKS